MRSAVALTHVPFEDLGTLGGVLAECEFSVESLDVCTADPARLNALDPDLLVVLGGPIGVYETQTYPFLTHEIDLIRRRLTARRATLGICLGAQLMATALGARVYPGQNGKEIGWAPIKAGPEAAMCPAMAELLAAPVQVLHWHGDTFDLPPGATHLAATSQYANQAFARGHQALALQFHPEVQAHALERWYVGHACELAGARLSVPALRAEAALHAPGLEQAARRFWRHWLASAF